MVSFVLCGVHALAALRLTLGQAIAVALKEPESCLSRLTCANCKLGGEALEMILAAMAANTNLKDVKVTPATECT